MSVVTLALAAVLATATALLYVHVGRLTLRRPAASAPARSALRLFGLWWLGLAATTAVTLLEMALAALGVLDLPLYRTLRIVTVLPIVLILWGLVSYLAYIYTGSARVFLPIALFHAAVLAFLVYFVVSNPPTGFALDEWGVMPSYDEPPAGGTLALALVLILLPALAAAVGYASLYFRTEDRTTRYRIALVSGAFILWFGSAGVASLASLDEWRYWPPTSRLIALVATLMILAAYRPPRWAQERFAVQPTEIARRSEEMPAAPWDASNRRLGR